MQIIKNFLMPFCPICRVSFKSRMLYEKHVATLTHIKNKVNMEKAYERRRQESRQADRSSKDDDDGYVDLNLDNFMILDAVGSVDGDGVGDRNQQPLDDLAAVGEEFVKKVEVYFCDVCQRYLNRTEPLDKVIELHCRSRAHHHAIEERRAASDEKDDKTETKQVADESANRGSGSVSGDENDNDNDNNGVEDGDKKDAMKRTESEERLWQEAEKDIGELCDIISEDVNQNATEAVMSISW